MNKDLSIKPYYTIKGDWRPSIHGCICVFCGVTFTAHSKAQRFCTKKCASNERAKLSAEKTHTIRECPGCSKLWSAAQSNPSQYCSKECIFESGKWVKPRDSNCGVCRKLFKANYRRVREDWELFCSHECASIALKAEKIEKQCVCCGKQFMIYESRNGVTCSIECRTKYFIRDRNPHWLGGLIDQGNRAYRRIDRLGYTSQYEGEHRLVAAREIGRQLQRGEVVLCLDKDNNNHDPKNLYLCPNMKEFGLINSSVVEWPEVSNLSQYRDFGYTRPIVILVLQNWENPRYSTNGKRFTQHPQADEIIKRRISGASVRELARTFGMSVSGMANVVKNRL
jgi:hypothetical protein